MDIILITNYNALNVIQVVKNAHKIQQIVQVARIIIIYIWINVNSNVHRVTIEKIV